MPQSPGNFRPRFLLDKRERDREYTRTRRNKESAKIYDSAHWRKRFRPWFLAQYWWCATCLAEGRGYVGANHVHHKRCLVEHPEDAYDPEQCAALSARATRGTMRRRGEHEWMHCHHVKTGKDGREGYMGIIC